MRQSVEKSTILFHLSKKSKDPGESPKPPCMPTKSTKVKKAKGFGRRLEGVGKEGHTLNSECCIFLTSDPLPANCRQ
jgi:hypothetical protein